MPPVLSGSMRPRPNRLWQNSPSWATSSQCPRKAEAWRNTEGGNKVGGVRPPRLTREKAEELWVISAFALPRSA
jgi:hypothetical protein